MYHVNPTLTMRLPLLASLFVLTRSDDFWGLCSQDNRTDGNAPLGRAEQLKDTLLTLQADLSYVTLDSATLNSQIVEEKLSKGTLPQPKAFHRNGVIARMTYSPTSKRAQNDEGVLGATRQGYVRFSDMVHQKRKGIALKFLDEQAQERDIVMLTNDFSYVASEEAEAYAPKRPYFTTDVGSRKLIPTTSWIGLFTIAMFGEVSDTPFIVDHCHLFAQCPMVLHFIPDDNTLGYKDVYSSVDAFLNVPAGERLGFMADEYGVFGEIHLTGTFTERAACNRMFFQHTVTPKESPFPARKRQKPLGDTTWNIGVLHWLARIGNIPKVMGVIEGVKSLSSLINKH